MRLKSNLYVRTTPQGSSSHTLKDSLLWGSPTKDYKVHNNGIHNNLHILFFSKISIHI
jgi:hypothetical protein